MPQRQLILHVGFHKSGTSALQESFNAQRVELGKLGVEYLDIGRKAHHRLAWALTQRPWGWKNRGGQRTPISHWQRAVRKINRSKSERILLSSEFFSELGEKQISRILQDIKNREIKVLFTLRPLVKLLGSSYQQYLKYGIKVDYEQWLHSVLDEPGVSKINPTFWKRNLHGKVIGRWAELVGKDQVSVVIVDESKPEFLFEAVSEVIGISKDVLKSQPTGSNRSLSLEEMALLLRINQLFPEKRNWTEYLIFVRNGYFRYLTDHVPVAPGKPKLATPAWAVAKGNQLGTQSMQEILNLGVRVIGDIESLGNAKVLEGSADFPSEIDIETVAQAMLSFDRKFPRRLPIRWLRKAIFRKVSMALKYGVGGKYKL